MRYVALSFLGTTLAILLSGAILFLLRAEIWQTITPVESIEMSAPQSVQQSVSEIIPDVIASANPAVVSVVATKDVPILERYYEQQWDPFGWFGGIAVPRVRERGTEEREVGGGSGFIVSADGHVVTNRHVVSDEEARYTIVMNDGTQYDVTVLAKDPVLDIAILQIDSLTDDLPYLTFSTKELRLGETVIVIGNALAEFRNSASVGIISGLARSITASDGQGRSERLSEVIQTDAAINPGNSGGPMLNLQGEVIGVSVATTRGADNISFALPAEAVAAIVSSVQEHGKIIRPYLGVRYTMVSPRLKELNNLSVDYGALIARGESPDQLAVLPGSPADKAGLVENDIILKINDTSLQESDLATILRDYEVGDELRLQVLHRGEEKTVTVILETMPE